MKVLIRTFLESRFNYCPLIWMFCIRTLNHRINRLHERALRIACGGYSSDSKKLLEKYDTMPVHKRNLRALAIEYKILNNLSPLFIKNMMTEIYVHYNTRSTTKVGEDNHGISLCTKICNCKIPDIKPVPYAFRLPPSPFPICQTVSEW